MPELRKDPIIGRWAIISTNRGKRPTSFGEPLHKADGRFCPFCYGNEKVTPPEILAFRKNDSAPKTEGWSLRVVANKFPALEIEGGLNKRADGIYDKMNGVGAHEVIIETPHHEKTLSSLPLEKVENVFWAYRERIMDLKRDTRLKYVLIFKNEGISAGASLEHSHSQLIALPIVPKRVAEEMKGAHLHYEHKERCIYCDIIQQELDARIRVITENENYVAIEPFTPRFPFETWILPKVHYSSFELMSRDLFAPLAAILQDTLKRIDKTLNVPPYNFILHTSPIGEELNDYYHWHIEIMPKLTRVAGFEWGSGFYINPTPPEEAAEFLREARV
jgi:UDPglucose--hexose-1-phosphate uridylyltransferase